jgi:hypothetical protein
MNNSTISTPKNTEHSLNFFQICVIYYIVTSLAGLLIILGKWNENNITKFKTYLLKISNENVWLHRFLFILSIIFYTIFISALICILTAICLLCYFFIDLIFGLYQCFFTSGEKIIPTNCDELV